MKVWPETFKEPLKLSLKTFRETLQVWLQTFNQTFNGVAILTANFQAKFQGTTPEFQYFQFFPMIFHEYGKVYGMKKTDNWKHFMATSNPTKSHGVNSNPKSNPIKQVGVMV